MHRSKSLLLLPIFFSITSISPLNAQAWIEYTVTGDASHEDREEDVVMCGLTDEAFLVHTLGAWNVSIEADNTNPGEHGATFMVAAPDSISALQVPGVDDRLRGDGIVTIADGGMGQYGFPRVEVIYEATGLSSGEGTTIDIKGKFVCDVM